MKESISYTFLLNIILIFVFVCACVITGIFSYYRAFRANTIIVNEIEKYEGYNCEANDSIREKLNSIGYNVPFNVECNQSFGKPCITDLDKDYAVVAYNLDYSVYTDTDDDEIDENDSRTLKKIFNDKLLTIMDADVSVDGRQTKIYQYGVYTYMYLDLPIVSGLLKIPISSRTREMYDFRNLKVYPLYQKEGESAVIAVDDSGVSRNIIVDYNNIPDDLKNEIENGSDIPEDQIAYEFARRVLVNYTGKRVSSKDFEYGFDPDIYGHGNHGSILEYDIREAYRYYDDTLESAQNLLEGSHSCGFKNDWSVF